VQQPGLHGRHRNRNGEIGRKHGNTLIKTLRGIYGPNFARNCSPDATLADELEAMDEPSLTRLVKDFESGALAKNL
jgi:hypothetical protein